MGGVQVNREDGITELILPPTEVQNTVLCGDDALSALMQSDTFTPLVFAYLWKRKFIKQNNFRFDGRLSEDDLWTTKAMCLASEVLLAGCVHYNYIKRKQSLTASNKASVLRMSSHNEVAMHLFEFLIGQVLSEETKGWIACKVLYLVCDVLKSAQRLSESCDVSLELCRKLKSFVVESGSQQIKRIGFTYLMRIQNFAVQSIAKFVR